MKGNPLRLARAGAALLGLLGAVALVWAQRSGAVAGVGPGLRALACVAILATSVGPPLALGLWLAPAPEALKLRHFVAGSTAAWLAWELASAVQRAGLAGDADAFRVLWAPASEELCKAALFAAVWTLTDDSRDRAPLASSAIGIGMGFAMRENYIYLDNMLRSGDALLIGVALRAVPPVLAHGLFAIILGSTVAQGAVHARACGLPPARVSLVGYAVALGAHTSFNGVALLLGHFGGYRSPELTALWTLVAGFGWWATTQRVKALAAQDEPMRASLAPETARRDGALLAVPPAVLAVGLVPTVFTRALALTLAPLAATLVLALFVQSSLRGGEGLRARMAASLAPPRRAIAALCLGISCRPLLWAVGTTAERAAATLHLQHRGLVAHLAFTTVTGLPWAWALGALVRGSGAARAGAAETLRYAVLVGAGLVGASLGGQLAYEAHPSLRSALVAMGYFVPTALADAAAVGLLARRAGRGWPLAVSAWALVSAMLQQLPRATRGAWWTPALMTLLGVAMLAAAVRTAKSAAREELTSA